MNTAAQVWREDLLTTDIKEPRARIISSRDFIADFVPPDYLVEGILMRGFLYSLTAPTGGGKTAIQLLLASLIDRGEPLGDNRVERGRVLYLAGENPTDIRMRWICMADQIGFDADVANVHFVAGTFSISNELENLKCDVEKIGGVQLVMVDTSAAYFEGDVENDNVQMLRHAHTLRTLTELPGGPAVVAACHPVKNAGNDNLLPRGGGAFLNEIDGNLVCKKRGEIVDLHWQGKFRGPEFAPIGFELQEVTSEKLKDSKGKIIPTVMAKPMTDTRRIDIESEAYSDENKVLLALLDRPGISVRAICDANEWMTGDGKKYYVSKAQRALNKLRQTKHAEKGRSGWELTEKGKKEAETLKKMVVN